MEGVMEVLAENVESLEGQPLRNTDRATSSRPGSQRERVRVIRPHEAARTCTKGEVHGRCGIIAPALERHQEGGYITIRC